MKNFNLQLFGGAQDWYANGYGESLNTNVTTDPGLAPENHAFYVKTLIANAEPNLVYRQFAQKVHVPKGGGQKASFRKYSALPKAMTPLTEGVTPVGNKLNVSSKEVTIKQFGDYVTLADYLCMTALDDNVIQATKLNGAQSGLTLDSLTRDVACAGTNVNFCPIDVGGVVTDVDSRYKLDTTAKLTIKQIRKAVAKLRKNNAQTFDGYFVGIIHPYMADDLMDDKAWENAKDYADPENLLKGEVGRIAGVRFVVSSQAKIFAGANLASDGRTLSVNGAKTNATVLDFDGGTVEANALVGRYVIVKATGGDVLAKVTANTASAITIDTAVTVADNALIYPGEGGKDGVSVFGTLIVGQNAYGTVDIEGGGLQVFIEQLGSAGTADALHQRSTVGWKASNADIILSDEFMVRIESTYADDPTVEAN